MPNQFFWATARFVHVTPLSAEVNTSLGLAPDTPATILLASADIATLYHSLVPDPAWDAQV
jgi:hypothetical protein